MNVRPEWVSALAESVAAIGVILVGVQLFLTKQQLKLTTTELKLAKDELNLAKNQLQDDHERSRRQAAINNLLTWTNSLTPTTSSTRRLVDLLEQSDCSCLEHIQEFDIDVKHKELLKSCFVDPQNFSEEPGKGRISLTKSQVSELRYRTINYLNTLESIFSAWHHNVSDRAIISEQFQYMLAPQNGHTLLKKFRIAAGENNYPAIRFFELHFEQLRNPKEGKAPLGLT